MIVMFNVGIIGGQNIEDYEFFKKKCINCLRKKAEEKEHIVIYTIGDDFVDKFAKTYHINTRFFPTEWNQYKKEALKIRNQDFIRDCNALIMFDDGMKDTQIIYNLAIEKGIPTRCIKH